MVAHKNLRFGRRDFGALASEEALDNRFGGVTGGLAPRCGGSGKPAQSAGLTRRGTLPPQKSMAPIMK